MGILLKLPTLSEIETPLRHQRLRRRAGILAILFTGIYWFLAFSVAAGLVAVMVYHGRNGAFGPEGGLLQLPKPIDPLPPGYIYFADLAMPYRIAMLFAGIAQFVPAVLVIRHLRGLFRLYAEGIVFAEANARAFKRMGQWLIAYAVAPFLSVQILTLIDLVIDRAWFHATEVYSLGLGIVLLIIAEVMEAGREIEQERDEFV